MVGTRQGRRTNAKIAAQRKDAVKKESRNGANLRKVHRGSVRKVSIRPVLHHTCDLITQLACISSVSPLQAGKSADCLESGGSHVWKLDSGEEFNRKPREKRMWSSHDSDAETSAQKRHSATDSEGEALNLFQFCVIF